MFAVEKIENGYLLVSDRVETFFKNERALVTGIREVLGMKKVGRPAAKKVEEKVFNGLDTVW
jgi:hypothetical protein